MYEVQQASNKVMISEKYKVDVNVLELKPIVDTLASKLFFHFGSSVLDHRAPTHEKKESLYSITIPTQNI